MKLSELEPRYVRREERVETWTRRKEDGSDEQVTGPRNYYVECSRDEAKGIEFLCPKCFQEKGGPVGCHVIICWQPDVPADVTPGPGRWQLVGRNFEDLSLVANPTSVQLNGGCNAHFTVSGGNVGFN